MNVEGVKVTAIVPTLAEAARRESLLRAVGSLRRASTDRLRILVVVNGDRFDRRAISLLQEMPEVEIHRVDRGSLPLATEIGRGLVSTPFFCFLDDDDEYLPGAIDWRLKALNADPAADFVITNGYRDDGERESLALHSLANVGTDPLRSLFDCNWLASCGGLFRTERIGVEFFRDIVQYAEWTWIAFRLAHAGKRVAALDLATFRIHETTGSASKSDAYRRTFPSLYRRMLAAEVPRDLRRVLRGKMSDAWHDICTLELAGGNRWAACRCHLASLASVHGLRYLPYTRYLLMATNSGAA